MIPNGLSAKEFMEEFASRSKKIFNPAITEEGSSIYGIKVITDLPDTTGDIITFLINGLSTDSSSKEILSTIGFANVTEENKFCAANLAPSRIIKAGVGSESDKLILYFIHDNKNNSAQLIKTSVEVFIQQDNKNHAMSISYLTEEEYQSIESDLETITEGEIDSHFSFSINTGDSIINITNGVDIVTPIDYIANAKHADALNNDITININNGISDPLITGYGEIDGGNLIGNLELLVNTQPIVEEVLNNLNIPVASPTVLGGINIAGNTYVFNNPEFPVKIKSENGHHYAYIDLTGFADSISQDIHRYTDMADATRDHDRLGEIVQFIGPTEQDYVHGYFYMRVRELIQGLLTPGTNWQFTNPVTGQSALNNAITEYNKLNDHLLTISQVLTLTPDVDTISENLINDDTVFNVVNGNFTGTLTYADICSWGINLATLTYDDTHPELFVSTITLSYINESNPPIWRLKNVQPSIGVDSPLVYKGIIESETGETDIDALERQVTNPEQGWVYTVIPSKQEYFWNGKEWEYMGQLIDVPEYTAGDAIDINSSNEISVLYDGSSIWTGDDGLLVSPELYVSGNDNISVEEKDEDFRAISVLGYKWDPDQKSFAEGKFSDSEDTPAQGSYSHTEGRGTKTEGLAAHAEGYYTLASGKSAHAEGYGVWCKLRVLEAGSNDLYLKLLDHTKDNSSTTLENKIKNSAILKSEFDFLDIANKINSGENLVIQLGIEPNNIIEEIQCEIWEDEIYKLHIVFTNDFESEIIEGGFLELIIQNTASSNGSHSEGKNTYATGKNSHAEGLVTLSSGENSHAEGHITLASGKNSHAEGLNTTASNDLSHAEGYSEGIYKLEYYSSESIYPIRVTSVTGDKITLNSIDYIPKRSDAGYNSETLNRGNVILVSAYEDPTSSDFKENNIEFIITDTNGNTLTCIGTVNAVSVNDYIFLSNGRASGKYSHSEGRDTFALNETSHSEGKNTIARGSHAHSEGLGTLALGDSSHAEGIHTIATYNYDHAEGEESVAKGRSSHAEGSFTTASGQASHAEGSSTTASGYCSHAEGYNTITNGNTYGEHAEGKFNLTHAGTIHSIGIGDYNTRRTNAFEIISNGEAYLYGVGGYDGVHIKSETGYENTKTLQEVLGAIPSNTLTGVTFNGTSATVSGGVASITASVGDTNVIETIKINGTALTPDSNKAVDITVFSGSGNSHTSGLVPDPGATAGISKYLCEDGTWSTPADSDTTYTFAEGSTDGAFNVTPSGGSASSVTVHNVLKTTGGTMTGQVYHTINSPTISSNTVTITCDKKYNWVTLLGGTLALTIMQSSLDGPCEVICAVKNTDSSNSMTLTLPSSTSTVHNMIGENSFTIGPNKIAEIVFTFWSTTDVSFNGGVEQ